MSSAAEIKIQFEEAVELQPQRAPTNRVSYPAVSTAGVAAAAPSCTGPVSPTVTRITLAGQFKSCLTSTRQSCSILSVTIIIAVVTILQILVVLAKPNQSIGELVGVAVGTWIMCINMIMLMRCYTNCRNRCTSICIRTTTSVDKTDPVSLESVSSSSSSPPVSKAAPSTASSVPAKPETTTPISPAMDDAKQHGSETTVQKTNNKKNKKKNNNNKNNNRRNHCIQVLVPLLNISWLFLYLYIGLLTPSSLNPCIQLNRIPNSISAIPCPWDTTGSLLTACTTAVYSMDVYSSMCTSPRLLQNARLCTSIDPDSGACNIDDMSTLSSPAAPIAYSSWINLDQSITAIRGSSSGSTATPNEGATESITSLLTSLTSANQNRSIVKLQTLDSWVHVELMAQNEANSANYGHGVHLSVIWWNATAMAAVDSASSTDGTSDTDSNTLTARAFGFVEQNALQCGLLSHTFCILPASLPLFGDTDNSNHNAKAGSNNSTTLSTSTTSSSWTSFFLSAWSPLLSLFFLVLLVCTHLGDYLCRKCNSK